MRFDFCFFSLFVGLLSGCQPAIDPIQTEEIGLQPELANISYTDEIKPLLEQRCVVCHACYDAPCQLKLGSMEGIQRGANKDRVYDGERLAAANLTRLFEDAHTLSQWREKDFFPVIADKAKSPSENVNASPLVKMLLQKKQHPMPDGQLLDESFELGLNREYQCPSNNEFDQYKQDNPLWGMPYGLPGLSEQEHQKLVNWVAYGAKDDSQTALKPAIQSQVDNWERFFNQDSHKAQLMSRYLFEHLFLVNISFADNPTFFRLVRSATPPGQKVSGIFTRRPFGDPQVERVYYRLQSVKGSIAHKNHMPMIFDQARQSRWNEWFIEADYQVSALPSYKPEHASNPFITFAQIPQRSRYKFMLDEAQNTIMQFIKGPVCRGQMALNVINDHFWVLFADPDLDGVENNQQFMQQARQRIALPAEAESTALPTAWLTYSAMEKDYLKAKSAYIEKHIKNKLDVNLDLLWDGDGNNSNLALTVFRHNDAATVVKGLVGDSPQTAWVLTYSLFERIHYLLVAGYDVYGNLGHQLNSRMYMDFLRMEGEFNFLNFLPLATRKKERDKWYRGSVSEVEKFVYTANQAEVATDIQYKTSNHVAELYTKVKARFADVISQKHEASSGFDEPSVLTWITEINQLQGKNISFLPQSAIVRVSDVASGQNTFYTLLRHSAYTNISHLFNEQDRRIPEEDTVTLAPNLMTSHPNALFDVKRSELESFAAAIAQLSSEQDYATLMANFGVRRTSVNFWMFIDEMHAYFKNTYPLEFGVLDLNRLENR